MEGDGGYEKRLTICREGPPIFDFLKNATLDWRWSGCRLAVGGEGVRKKGILFFLPPPLSEYKRNLYL